MSLKYGPCIKQQVGDEAERFRELAEASMLEASSRIAALERQDHFVNSDKTVFSTIFSEF